MTTSREWRKRASCRGLPIETFFPEPANKRPLEAIAICQTCPVKTECRREADSHLDMYTGVWGGTTQRQRIREARQKRENNDHPGE